MDAKERKPFLSEAALNFLRLLPENLPYSVSVSKDPYGNETFEYREVHRFVLIQGTVELNYQYYFHRHDKGYGTTSFTREDKELPEVIQIIFNKMRL